MKLKEYLAIEPSEFLELTQAIDEDILAEAIGFYIEATSIKDEVEFLELIKDPKELALFYNFLIAYTGGSND